jgi:imidazolonepropionase
VARVVDEMIPKVASEGLARFCDVFYEKGVFNRTETRRILKAAAAAGLKTKLHADEFSNSRGAGLGVELGCTSVDHLMQIDPEGVSSLARSGTAAVLLPLVHRASFEARTAPARALVDAGAIVALGTDFNPNCHNPSMLEAFRAAVFDLRLRPREALAAATLNAAYALDEHGRTGSLETGRRADFLVIDAGDVDEVAYRQGENPIRSVCAGGRFLDPP